MAFSLFPILSRLIAPANIIAPAAAFLSGVRSARPGEAGIIPGLSRLANYYARRSALGRSGRSSGGRSRQFAPPLISPPSSALNGP